MPEPLPSLHGLEDESVLTRFALAGYDCLVVPLCTTNGTKDVDAGTLQVLGKSYSVLVRLRTLNGHDPIEQLTPRELEIATLIAGGCCDKEVARRLGISCHTVGAHIARCFAKLGLHKRTELAACVAARLGNSLSQPRMEWKATSAGEASVSTCTKWAEPALRSRTGSK